MQCRAYVVLAAVGLAASLLSGCGGAGQDAFGGLGNVVGRVSDGETGVPVSGAAVSVGGLEATTDSSGRYSLVNVPIGEQAYAVVATGYLSDSGSLIRVNPGVSVSLDVALTPELAAAGTVSGTVASVEDGTPISGVSVTVGSLSDTTDSLGAFEIVGVPEGEQTLSFEKPAYAPASETVTVVANGSHRVDVTMESISVGTVSGTVVDSRNGSGIAGVSVFLEESPLSTVTGDDGAYTLGNVPTGTHSISYHRTGYQSETYSVSVVAGGTTAQDVSLVAPAAGTLTGTIYNLSTGEPLDGVAVSISGLGRSTTSGDVAAPSAPTGAYTFADVPSGSYEMVFSLTNYESETAGPVNIDAGTTTVFDVRLQPLLARIEGFVLQIGTGSVPGPVAGATVRLGPTRTTTSASDGSYSFDDVPPLAAGEEYVIEASALDFRPGTTRVEVPDPGTVVHASDIILTQM